MKNNIIAIDVSKEYVLHIDKVLERSKIEILEWFSCIEKEFKVNTYIYKDIQSLRNGLKKRGLGLYPSHMVACMIDEDLSTGIRRSINLYEPPTIADEKSYNKKEYDYVVFHELVHYITDMIYGKLPEWLTEGIAKILDNTYKEDLTNLMPIINTYEIPSISSMKGDFFILKKYESTITEDAQEIQKEITIYNGYDLSYIMVRYLIEVYGKEYLFSLMDNKKEIKRLEQSILNEAIDYFTSKYLKENTIKNKKI